MESRTPFASGLVNAAHGQMGAAVLMSVLCTGRPFPIILGSLYRDNVPQKFFPFEVST
jgi:hypothetical protein